MQRRISRTCECKPQVLIYLCSRSFHLLVITLPTNHCSREMEANGTETSVVVQSSCCFYCLGFVRRSTPPLWVFCHHMTPGYLSVYFTCCRGTALGSFIFYRLVPCWYMELLDFYIEAFYLQRKHFDTVSPWCRVCVCERASLERPPPPPPPAHLSRLRPFCLLLLYP